jgi:hypothetical protein
VDNYRNSNALYLCFPSLEIAAVGALCFLVPRQQGCGMSVSVAPTLCDQCSPMFQGSFYSMKGTQCSPVFEGSFVSTKGNLHDHHISIQSLEQAANKNCIICRDVWKDLVGRSDFDRENLDAEAARVGCLTRYWIDQESVDVRCWPHKLVYHSYRYLETQRKSALQPSRVQTPCTNVKQWNIKPHYVPHPPGPDLPRT